MQSITSIIAFLAAAGTSLAAPAPASGAVSKMAADQTWTIENFQRQCTLDGTSCHITFGVNTNDGSAVTLCDYSVNGTPAANAPYSDVACGTFFVGSSHSDQGFTVLSVKRDGAIVYPGYTDEQLASGGVVKPDQSYTPTTY